MKTILFLWVFLLPIKMFAKVDVENLIEERQSLVYQLLENNRKTSSYLSESWDHSSYGENQIAMRIIEKDNAIIQKLQLKDQINYSSLISENEQYKTITLSQEQDIQKLKIALSKKGYEINASKLEKRNFELASLIFFLSTVIFGWLFAKDKVAFELPKLFTFSSIITEKE